MVPPRNPLEPLVAYEGYPPHLASAAKRLGIDAPQAAVEQAGNQPAVRQISNLVSQIDDRPGDYPDAVRVIRQARDALAVALSFADSMLCRIDPPRIAESSPVPPTTAKPADPFKSRPK
jgi:hypothetical protein